MALKTGPLEMLDILCPKYDLDLSQNVITSSFGRSTWNKIWKICLLLFEL